MHFKLIIWMKIIGINNWYYTIVDLKKKTRVAKGINFLNHKNELLSKEIHPICKNRELWPIKSLKYSCHKFKYFNYQVCTKCKSILKSINITNIKDIDNVV